MSMAADLVEVDSGSVLSLLRLVDCGQQDDPELYVRSVVSLPSITSSWALEPPARPSAGCRLQSCARPRSAKDRPVGQNTMPGPDQARPLSERQSMIRTVFEPLHVRTWAASCGLWSPSGPCLQITVIERRKRRSRLIRQVFVPRSVPAHGLHLAWHSGCRPRSS